MPNILRILLFLICITAAFQQPVIAAEKTSSEDHEVLEKTYVKINSEEANPSEMFEINRLAESAFKKIRERYYSLLNWKVLRRSSQQLTIPDYDRKAMFGTWVNKPNDESCLNTRAIVLIRDSNKKVSFEQDNCTVSEGYWHDDYTNRIFTKREDIQIDHVVALKNAYMSGAYRWGFRARCLYANYLGNQYHLKSVNSSENMRKGDKAPDRYMPPNPAHACDYIKNWLTIKFTWGLQMTEPEALAIAQHIQNHKCSAKQLQITQSEIDRERTFFKENINLCDHIVENRSAPIADTDEF